LKKVDAVKIENLRPGTRKKWRNRNCGGGGKKRPWTQKSKNIEIVKNFV